VENVELTLPFDQNTPWKSKLLETNKKETHAYKLFNSKPHSLMTYAKSNLMYCSFYNLIAKKKNHTQKIVFKD
jgi:hypothetical protein